MCMYLLNFSDFWLQIVTDTAYSMWLRRWELFYYRHQLIFTQKTLVNGAAFIGKKCENLSKLTFCLGITTLGDDTVWYWEWICWQFFKNFVNSLVAKTTKGGKSLFEVISISLVCKRCQLKYLNLNKKSEICKHKLGMWRDFIKITRL